MICQSMRPGVVYSLVDVFDVVIVYITTINMLLLQHNQTLCGVSDL